MRWCPHLWLVVLIASCGDDDGGKDPDGSTADAAGPDAETADAAGPDAETADAAGPDAETADAAAPDAATCDFSTPGVNLGSACATGDTCTAPAAAVCEPATPSTISSLNLDESPGPDLSGTVYPSGGECTIQCLLGFDGCGDCAVCAPIFVGPLFFFVDIDTSGYALGVCRPRCTPSPTDNGGCRPGYTCDLALGLCVEACQSDSQCRYARLDVDGDGQDDVAYLGDAYPATCNNATGRCTTMGNDGALPGDPCAEPTDCEDDGLCIEGPDWPAGYCSRQGCEWPGFECATGAVCDIRGFGDQGFCFDGCQIGAEPEEERLGSDGKGAGCQVGFACQWDGTSGVATNPNGGCQPGTYNDITVPNVGGPCLSDDECYSPFGYGRCVFRDELEVDSGICMVSNCATFMVGTELVDGILPGIETTTRVCDSNTGEACLNFGSGTAPPSTFCMLSCLGAAECAPGYACPELLSDGTRFCWPYCFETADCRSGASCVDAAGGACDPATEDCYCSDRRPRN